MNNGTLERYLILRKEEAFKEITEIQDIITNAARTGEDISKEDLNDYQHRCYEYRKLMELLDIYRV